MNKDLVLADIELCKQLAPLMEGIEPDGCHWQRFDLEWFYTDEYQYKISDKGDYFPTWRQDKLELRLPDTCFTNLFKLRMSVNEIVWELIEDLFDRIKISQGESKRKATAELILLLNKEGLLDGK